MIQWEITPACPDFIKLNVNGNALTNAGRDVVGGLRCVDHHWIVGLSRFIFISVE